jgi:hypothetical protein
MSQSSSTRWPNELENLARFGSLEAHESSCSELVPARELQSFFSSPKRDDGRQQHTFPGVLAQETLEAQTENLELNVASIRAEGR